MKANLKPGAQAFTLMELLLSLVIIVLLICMLLPALSRGHAQVKRVQCSNNLRQTGLGMIYFAQAHEDKFPMQVSTNLGGSAEFIAAGNAVSGEFYFSYKHFLPLAPDMESPKLLTCPTDARRPAVDFRSLRNTNLSYFVAANPIFMKSEAILSGDRNLAPSSNSIACVGVYRPLKWTGEMHQYRGNVLFADGHVEQLKDVLSLSNSPGALPVSLVMPSAPTPSTATANASGGGPFLAGGGGVPFRGGNLSVSVFSSNSNLVLTNGVLTNLTITSEPRPLPPGAYSLGGPVGGSAAPAPILVGSNGHLTGPVPLTVRPAPADSVGETEVQAAHQNFVETGRDLARRGTRFVYGAPWWLLALLLLATLLALKYVREHRRPPAQDSAKMAPWFVAGKRGS